jgi:hypothetical protein
MRTLSFGILLAVVLSGCGAIEEVIRRNDDRYMQPGALDPVLKGYYDVYNIPFLGQYQITHDWPVIGSCEYRAQPTLNRVDRYKGEIYAVRDIYEEDGKTLQRFEGRAPYNFNRYVRSVKFQEHIYEVSRGRSVDTGKTREIEVGLQPVCLQTWHVASVTFMVQLYKRDLAAWQMIESQRNPKAKWSKRVVGLNTWTVQETAEQDFRPRPLNGVGGPYQYWFLPIGKTGYTLAFELGASQDTLKYPSTFEHFKSAFRHLIESVKVEPLRP